MKSNEKYAFATASILWVLGLIYFVNQISS